MSASTSPVNKRRKTEELCDGSGLDGPVTKVFDKTDPERVAFSEFMKLSAKPKYKVLEEMEEMSMELGDELPDAICCKGGRLPHYCFRWVIREAYDTEASISEDGIEKVTILETKNVLYMFVDYSVVKSGTDPNENGLKKPETKFRLSAVTEHLDSPTGMYYDPICSRTFTGRDVGDLNFYAFLTNMCEDMEDEIRREYSWVEGRLENYEHSIGPDTIAASPPDNTTKHTCGLVNTGDGTGVSDQPLPDYHGTPCENDFVLFDHPDFNLEDWNGEKEDYYPDYDSVFRNFEVKRVLNMDDDDPNCIVPCTNFQRNPSDGPFVRTLHNLILRRIRKGYAPEHESFCKG